MVIFVAESLLTMALCKEVLVESWLLSWEMETVTWIQILDETVCIII